ncbi:MAG: hypothetical protein PUF50_07295 [Erysipelotrichaceae bacterium]|nr:hypothetical protein [Erysipelotrichaceae bacterium]
MEFYICRNLITQRAREEVNTDNVNGLSAKFFFAEDYWSGVTKTVTFTKGSTVKTAVLTEKDVLNFRELGLTAGTWTIKVTGGDKSTQNATFIVESVTYDNLTSEQINTIVDSAVDQYFEQNPSSGDTTITDEQYTAMMEEIFGGQLGGGDVGGGSGGSVGTATITDEQVTAGMNSIFGEGNWSE